MSENESRPVEPSRQKSTAAAFFVGEWLVDPALDSISRGDETLKLEPRKMQLLVALASRPGEVVSAEELLDRVWPGLVVTQSSVYQTVAQLRKTLGDDTSSPRYIATIARKGYRLVATVRPVEPASAATEVSSAVRAVEDDGVIDAPSRPSRPVSRRAVLVGAVGSIAAAGIGLYVWAPSRRVALPVRIAVLAFEDQSKGRIEQATANGLAEDVIHRFERYRDVLVSARDSAFTIRRDGEDRAALIALHERLHVDYALFGELFTTRERVSLAARLVSVATGKVLWTDVIVVAADRLPDLPDQIATRTIAALGLEPLPASARDSLGAYELLLLGNNALVTQSSMENVRKARDYFQNAIDTDPGYARAYTGAARTWLVQAAYAYGIDIRDGAARAQPLLDKSFALDPLLLDTLLAQGRLYTMTSWTDGERARSFMQKAVDLYPGNAEAQFGLGISYAYDEQPREAIRQYERALTLDPLNARIHGRWGTDAVFAGDFDDARAHYGQAALLQERYPWRHIGLGYLAYAQGRLDEAVGHYRLQLAQDPRQSDAWGELGWLYLDLGLPDLARSAFDRQSATSNGAYGAIDRAYALLVEGRPDALLAYLDRHANDDRAIGQREVERARLEVIAGRRPTVASIDAIVASMKSDTLPWVGSFWVFLGWQLWIDLAMLYLQAGAAASAAPFLDDAQAMLDRLRTRGNVFHTIAYLDARIAALRGRRDDATRKLTEAVSMGWRRTWLIRFDPAFASLRDDPVVAALVERTSKETRAQRERSIADGGQGDVKTAARAAVSSTIASRRSALHDQRLGQRRKVGRDVVDLLLRQGLRLRGHDRVAAAERRVIALLIRDQRETKVIGVLARELRIRRIDRRREVRAVTRRAHVFLGREFLATFDVAGGVRRERCRVREGDEAEKAFHRRASALRGKVGREVRDVLVGQRTRGGDHAREASFALLIGMQRVLDVLRVLAAQHRHRIDQREVRLVTGDAVASEAGGRLAHAAIRIAGGRTRRRGCGSRCGDRGSGCGERLPGRGIGRDGERRESEREREPGGHRTGHLRNA